MKPRDWKKVWVAWARALRMRATAPIRLVLGRRCSLSRRLSMLCPFLLRGYLPLPLSHLPNHRIFSAFSSTFYNMHAHWLCPTLASNSHGGMSDSPNSVTAFAATISG